jgi:hypothetical protein
MSAREVPWKDGGVQLHYDKATDAIYLQIADEPATESEEVRPGVVLDFDEVDVRRKTRQQSPPDHDERPTRTLADDARQLRDQLRARGVQPMTIEEFDRELAERRH